MRMIVKMAMSAVVAVGMAGMGGCAESETHHHDADAHMHGEAAAAHQHVNAWAKVNRAVAVMYPTRGSQVSGVLTFDKVANGVHITGSVTGLEPKSVHAMHIHEFGDSSSVDGAAAGGHYNPEGHDHAGLETAKRHAGDLGNITADDAGKATIDLTVDNITIAELRNPIVGRGVVIHAKEDDLKTQPTGNAGGRIAVGVIGVAKNPG